MWNVLSKEMRMPALAAAACAAVILVASPVSAATTGTVTSNVFLRQLFTECDGMVGKLKGNCMSARAQIFQDLLAESMDARNSCNDGNADDCDFWAKAYEKRFGELPQ